MRNVKAYIKPNSTKGPLVEELDDGTLMLFVREPAVDGKANAAAIALLARYNELPKSAIVLSKGKRSRLKTFIIYAD